VSDLIKMRAKLAELEAARIERLAAEEEAAEIEALDVQLRNAEAINKFEQELGKQGREIGVIDCEHLGLVIVRKPHAAAWKRFQDTSGKNITSDEVIVFVTPHVVFPTKIEFGQVCESMPATPGRCALVLAALAGSRKADLEGK